MPPYIPVPDPELSGHPGRCVDVCVSLIKLKSRRKYLIISSLKIEQETQTFETRRAFYHNETKITRIGTPKIKNSLKPNRINAYTAFILLVTIIF
jgi:hypothetical protein